MVPIACRGLAAVVPLDGRCPACRRLLGLRVGSVELLAAACLAVLAVSASSVGVLAAWSWAGLFGVARVLLTAAAVVTGDYPALLRAIGCAVVLCVVYLALVLNDRIALNRGDALLAPLIGACLGWISNSAVWIATLARILLAGAFVLPVALTHGISSRDAIPLGPFILFGPPDRHCPGPQHRVTHHLADISTRRAR